MIALAVPASDGPSRIIATAMNLAELLKPYELYKQQNGRIPYVVNWEDDSDDLSELTNSRTAEQLTIF